MLKKIIRKQGSFFPFCSFGFLGWWPVDYGHKILESENKMGMIYYLIKRMPEKIKLHKLALCGSLHNNKSFEKVGIQIRLICTSRKLASKVEMLYTETSIM